MKKLFQPPLSTLNWSLTTNRKKTMSPDWKPFGRPVVKTSMDSVIEEKLFEHSRNWKNHFLIDTFCVVAGLACGFLDFTRDAKWAIDRVQKKLGVEPILLDVGYSLLINFSQEAAAFLNECPSPTTTLLQDISDCVTKNIETFCENMGSKEEQEELKTELFSYFKMGWDSRGIRNISPKAACATPQHPVEEIPEELKEFFPDAHLVTPPRRVKKGLIFSSIYPDLTIQ